MAAFHFVIGALEIDPTSIVYTGDDVYHQAAHKFVVERRDGEAVIFACPAGGHQAVAEHFVGKLHPSNLVGGGSLYIDGDGVLVIGSYSGTYGFLPKDACERLAALAMQRCQEQGIAVNGARGDPEQSGFMQEWWESLG